MKCVISLFSVETVKEIVNVSAQVNCFTDVLYLIFLSLNTENPDLRVSINKYNPCCRASVQ